MKWIVGALAVISVCVAFLVGVLTTTMAIYLIKNAKWESALRKYRIDRQTSVVYKPSAYGEVRFKYAGELMEDLRGVEKRIAK